MKKREAFGKLDWVLAKTAAIRWFVERKPLFQLREPLGHGVAIRCAKNM